MRHHVCNVFFARHHVCKNIFLRYHVCMKGLPWDMAVQRGVFRPYRGHGRQLLAHTLSEFVDGLADFDGALEVELGRGDLHERF